MTKPDIELWFLTSVELAEKLRPQIAAAELAVLNAWAEVEDANLVLETSNRRLEILMSLWPEEISINAPQEDN